MSDPVPPKKPMQEEGSEEEELADPAAYGVELVLPLVQQPQNEGQDHATRSHPPRPAGTDPRPVQGHHDLPTYEQLGISTEIPKRPDMAMIHARVATYRNWPPANSHTPIQLAEAGFYYAGYADCVRCFFCGGGLKNWERNDNPWVEHARWFARCPYVRQCQGQDFIDIVQDLNATSRKQINFGDVENEVNRRRALGQYVQFQGSEVEEDIQSGEESDDSGDYDEGSVNQLVEENSEIRQQRMCKICLDKEVCIVFLPCGHLVCCAECSPVIHQCPVCRQVVKGRVRVFPE